MNGKFIFKFLKKVVVEIKGCPLKILVKFNNILLLRLIMAFMDLFAGFYEKDTWGKVESWQKFTFYGGILFLPFVVLEILDIFI
jgi:hypothetical protein